MKILIRDYLASLREREELDAIMPDLLSELGYTVHSRPQRGTRQAGVDIAAVGKDEDGERKLFLFSLKQGDLTRQSWDGTPQGLRSSLNEVLDTYIPTCIPSRYRNLKIVICLVFGGDMQEQVRASVTGFIKKNSSERISFDEWNGDKLAGLVLQGVLREEIMPKALKSHFQKSVAMVDEPDIAYQHFSKLVHELCRAVTEEKSRVRSARQIYIGLWVLFVWARDVGNVEAAYRASELSILNIWVLLKPGIGNKSKSANNAITSVLIHAIQLHLIIASELLERKVFPSVGIRDAISVAVQSKSPADINGKLFDILGRIALTGLWRFWFISQLGDAELKSSLSEEIGRFATAGFQLINNNPALFLPLEDQRAIEIALFLLLVAAADGNWNDARTWLREMVQRLDFTVRTHGRYPCIFTSYDELVGHPRESSGEYRKDATAGSILIPLVAAFLGWLNEEHSLKVLHELTKSELQHCTLQLWMPDEASEDGLYIGDRHHGLALCDLPLSASGKELIEVVHSACSASKDFQNLSAMATDFWPIILTACRHYRFPVPPQFWIRIIKPDGSPEQI